jgi:ABC-2 type transport system ATP-binding protein
VLGLLGPNGAGKSTTLQMLSGVLAPSSGSIRILGQDLRDNPRKAKAAVGFLPEHPPLYPELRVDEYLYHCARIRGIARHAVPKAVADVKRRCGLECSGKRRIGVLSKGYQQRVGIAQAIIHRPALVILDEPTAGLDPNQVRDIRALIRGLGARHAVILSSHILPEIQALCSRVHILHQGRLVFSSTLRALEQQGRETSLVLELEHPPPQERLLGVPGVAGAETLDAHRLRIHPAPGADPRSALANAAVAGDWGLLELRRESGDLERIFVELTTGETA